VADDRDAYRILQIHPEAHERVIRAAYRALAELYHPDRDQTVMATRRMAEINDAYNQVRTPDRRAAYDRLRRISSGTAAATVVPAGSSSSAPRPPRSNGAGHATHGQSRDQAKSGPEVIDFGRYAGWTIKQLARHDPDYLRWLARHSSGIRFRRPIEAALASVATPPPQPSESKRGRR
jgi:curved DNA-binding protein CbpA